MITRDDFLMIPELAMNPLVNRIVSLFDADNDDQVNFQDFIRALSVFSAKGGKDEKLQCMIACELLCRTGPSPSSFSCF